MITKLYKYMSIMLIVLGPVSAQASQVDTQLQTYLQQGATQINPENGKKLWYDSKTERSCASCHGDTPRSTGRHAKTRKQIQPMAPSVNPERYQDSRKIEKWFLRNCKWTLGRTCTVQEKADILGWLAGQ